MRLIVILLLSTLPLLTNAVDFSQLSTSTPVSTTYNANFKCYVDASFFLDLQDAPAQSVFVRATYIIGTDTLNDLVKVDQHFDGVLKRIFLDEGERLTILLRMNTDGLDRVDGIKGSLQAIRNPDIKPDPPNAGNSFENNIWRTGFTPLFRVVKEDSVPQTMQLEISFDQNYEFDRLFFKVKVISPADGILMLDKAIVVNEENYVTMRSKKVQLDLTEVDMSVPGTYYFQVMQNMAQDRVNGVQHIDHKLVPQ